MPKRNPTYTKDEVINFSWWLEWHGERYGSSMTSIPHYNTDDPVMPEDMHNLIDDIAVQMHQTMEKVMVEPAKESVNAT